MADYLVTGAGGFIGSAVAQVLARSHGTRVHGGTRDGRPLAGNITACRLDVLDPKNLANALSGMDGVVHCAVGDRAVTVGGTRNVLRAARAAGVRRLVHFSSIAVYGAARGAVTEACARVTERQRGYAGWKAAAEQYCAEAQMHGLETVILRPAIVYGPGSRDWVERPARRLLSGLWGTLGAEGDGLCNLVHVRDVARAAQAALTAPHAAGGAFNISDAAITWNEWHRRLALAMGLPPLRELPPGRLRQRALLSLPVKAAARLLRCSPSWLVAAPSLGEVRLFALDASYPATRAREVLGWAATVGLEQGLADSVAWLRARRGLSAP